MQVIADKQGYLQEAARLHAELSKIDGLMLMDSSANFMLAYMERGKAPRLKQWLLEHYGILIRDASNFHGLNSHCFRVSAQKREENDALLAAIREYLKDKF